MSIEEDFSKEPSPIDWGQWRPEMRATLMFIRDGNDVLLMRKLRGIGAGKINAPGGKIEPGETPLEGAVRETQEELLVTPVKPRKMGELFFAMSDLPDIFVHVFMAEDFLGEVGETEEAIPRWTKISQIPYDMMWEDDEHWLPRMLEGECFSGHFFFESERIRWMKMDWDVDYPG
ncbi:MAG TPA: NUDIX hydrolase [Verrucomicrobiales bacterium]|nr:NUDIX hydrolase [Verrucomicrobiales bacterium]